MLRKGSIILFLALVAPMLAWGQSTGKLTGVVTDAETGEPLPGANVVIQGTQLGASTNAQGQYTILGVPVGTYDVQASFVGYTPVTQSNVDINSGYTRQLDFSLQPGTQLEEVVVEYERPMIQNDAVGAVRVATSEEIENLPVRGVADVAALQAGVVSTEGSDDLNVRGGRNEEVAYYVDGVKVVGGVNSLGVPQRAIQEQEMLIGTIPARYGDAMSGVISITTKSGGTDFFGTVEGITSEVLDPYGYNLGSLSLGGPVWGNKLGFFISGSIESWGDANPYGIDLPYLPQDQLNRLQQNPQVVRAIGPNGNVVFRPVPAEGLEGVNVNDIEDELRSMTVNGDTVLPSGYSLASTNLIDAPQVYTRDSLSYRSSQDDPKRDYNLTGNVTFSPSQSIDIRLGGTFQYNTDRILGWLTGESFDRSIYNRNRFYEDETETARGYLTWRQRLSDNTFYQLQAEYTDRAGWTYPNRFSRDVRDALFYGDIDYEANETLANYWRVNTNNQLVRIQDGQINPGSVYGMFNLPGRGADYYEKFDQNMFRINGSATTQIGLNQLEFGAEYEQRETRFFEFEYSGGGLYGSSTLAGYYNDVNGNELGDEGVTSYEELPYSALRDRVRFYGYDFRGVNEVDGENISLYRQGVVNPANLEDSSFVYNVAPYEPIYYAGYVQDKIEYKDLVINLGARVDVFDNNSQVLRDIYTTTPVIRAGELQDVNVPAGIGSDAAVYFNNNNEVVGYRPSNTDQFYDAQGNEATFEQINQLGTPQAPTDENDETISGLHPRLFEEYDPQVTFMPRVGVSFPITNRALFFASYNVTSQRPSEEAFEPFSTYRGLTGQDVVSNSKLQPETTTQYELGFRQRVGERTALQISGFYRTQENKIRIRDLTEAFPSSYRTYVNEDFTTAKGVELGFDMRRTNNLTINANYTLQFAEATGSDANTLSVISWLAPGSVPNFISPATFDRRHSLNATLDYRLGENEGPEVFGARVFSNFGVNVLAVANSGFPYTQLSQKTRITNPQPSTVSGEIGDVRTPWTHRIDMKIDRRFSLGNGLSAKAYLWIQNVLDTQSALGVYRATGLVDNDGFLSTTEGKDAIRNARPSGPSFESHYREYMSGPVDVSSYNMSKEGRLYTMPRRTRIGVLINF